MGEVDIDICPVCRQPAKNPVYAPWCCRGCKRFARDRNASVDPDIVARRQAYLTSQEVSRLSTELRAVKVARDKLKTETKHLIIERAHLQEELAVLRYYAGDSVTTTATIEMARRRRLGGRRRTDVGAHFVLDLVGKDLG